MIHYFNGNRRAKEFLLMVDKDRNPEKYLRIKRLKKLKKLKRRKFFNNIKNFLKCLI